MAISYVGGKVGTASGSTTTDITVALDSGLAGGTGTAVSEGDLVVVTVCLAHSDDAPTADLVTTGYTALTQLDSDDTRDTSLQVHYKFMGATPDTSVVIARSGNIENSIAWTVQVFAGVDATTPMDVAAVPATGIDTGLADPAAITPVTAGAWIVICAGNNHSGTDTFTWSADFEDTLTAAASDTNDAKVGSAYYSGWTSGAYNPAATTTGGNLTSGSWCAYTLALRPAGAAAATISAAATFTLSAATLAAAATAAIAASASPTLAAATLASAATAAIAADTSVTLGTAVLASAATAAIAADTSVTLAAATLDASAGSPALTADASVTLGAATLASTATAAITADTSVTLAAATLDATTTVPAAVTTEEAALGAGSGGVRLRRKFKLPDEAITDPWSIDRLYREEPTEPPAQPDLTNTTARVPLTLANTVATLRPKILQVTSVPAPRFLPQVLDEDDEEFDNVVRLFAALL